MTDPARPVALVAADPRTPQNASGPANDTFVDTPLKAAVRKAFDYGNWRDNKPS